MKRIFPQPIVQSIFLSLLVLSDGAMNLLAESQNSSSNAITKVFFYAPMDGTMAPVIGSSWDTSLGRAESAATNAAATTGVSVFQPGRIGQGLWVGAPEQAPGGARPSYWIDMRNFPLDRGSVMLWFKPKGAQIGTLYCSGNATFEMYQTSGDAMLFYAGTHQDFVKGDLHPFMNDLSERWHFVVGVWDADKRRFYFDGELVGSRDGALPLNKCQYGVYPRFYLGFRHGSTSEPDSGFANAILDEFAILRSPLSDEEVKRLWRDGNDPAYKGLIQSLGGGILLHAPRRGYRRGEQVALSVLSYSRGTEARIVAHAEGSTNKWVLGALPSHENRFALNTTDLRPGRYGVSAELWDGAKQVASSPEIVLGVQPESPPAFSLGLWGGITESWQYEMLRKWHIDTWVTYELFPESGLEARMNEAYTYGISAMVNFNVFHHSFYPRISPEKTRDYFDKDGRLSPKGQAEICQILAWADGKDFNNSTGSLPSSIASPSSPVAQEFIKEFVLSVMKRLKDYPGLRFVSFQDEYDLRLEEVNKRLQIGDYNQHAVAHFMQQTGLKGPAFPPVSEPATIFPDQEPYIQWARIIGLPGDCSAPAFERAYRQCHEWVKTVRPDVTTLNISGSEGGELDCVMDYAYTSTWEPTPGYTVSYGRLDFLYDRHRYRQKQRPFKPLAGLPGWWSGDMDQKSKDADLSWCVGDFRLNTQMAIAKGVSMIQWALGDWNGSGAKKEQGILSRDDLKAEFIRWADWCHRYGPMLARLEFRPNRRVAVLLSESNLAGWVHEGHRWPGFLDYTYAALRSANAPVDLVLDQDVLEGRLQEYQALVLFHHRYSAKSVWQKIVEFAKTPGKRLFFSDPKRSDLLPPSAMDIEVVNHELSATGNDPIHRVINTHGEQVMKLKETVTPVLKPADLIVSGSDFISPHQLYGGQARYVFLVNLNLWEPQKIGVSFVHPGDAAYDVMKHERIAVRRKSERIEWNGAIAPADWQMVMLPPQAVESIDLRVNVKEREIELAGAVCGSKKESIPAIWPLEVTVEYPNGQATSHSFVAATDARGCFAARISLGKLTDPPGKYRVSVKEGITGKEAHGTASVGSTNTKHGDTP
ncbi:MAG: LamG domain-containing protein [Verrucomicrobia bacterium]|nr:LamG domain-containing protein [Verrucomicrobiota bacterium]